MGLYLKNLLFLVIVPGTVAGIVPLLLIARGGPALSGTHLLGLIPAAAGLALMLWCVLLFATAGGGTPAPVDPPVRLVIRGPYRIVRNPMYLGVFLLLLGEAVLWGSPGILFYAAGVTAAFHCFIVAYEEPGLRVRFGREYEAYRERVPRWFPALWPRSQ
jgi:protein-S-isoprenylcysteine O-methyltransferase Ste14